MCPPGQCVPLLQQMDPSGAHVPSRHKPHPGWHCAYAGAAPNKAKPIKKIPSKRRIVCSPFELGNNLRLAQLDSTTQLIRMHLTVLGEGFVNRQRCVQDLLAAHLKIVRGMHILPELHRWRPQTQMLAHCGALHFARAANSRRAGAGLESPNLWSRQYTREAIRLSQAWPPGVTLDSKRAAIVTAALRKRPTTAPYSMCAMRSFLVFR